VWAQEGDAAAITARLKQPEVRARVVAELKAGQGHYGAYTISSANPDFDGHTFQQIADNRHISVEEAMVDVLVQQKAEGFQIGPAEPSLDAAVAIALTNPWIDFGSDGIALPAGVHTAFGRPHPRSFGTHTHILGEYVRERHVFSLEEAIRKMTSQPANRLGLADRGLIRRGMTADVVVFDPATVRDTATYEKPDQYSQGIDWVLINGKPVIANGAPTNALPAHPPMDIKKYASKLIYRFEPCVFSTAEFPPGSLLEGDKIQAVLGQTRVETTFYNEKFEEVKKADTPGRYGAVVRITLGDGTNLTRFITLYRIPDGAPTQTIALGRVKVPMETGTGPDVSQRRLDEVAITMRSRTGNESGSEGFGMLLGLAKVMPGIRGRFATYDAYAHAGVDEIVGEAWSQARELQAQWLDTTLFLNRGTGFVARPLPALAQVVSHGWVMQ
jgi:hypothetical protein